MKTHYVLLLSCLLTVSTLLSRPAPEIGGKRPRLLARHRFLVLLLIFWKPLFFPQEAFAVAGGLDPSFIPGAGASLNGSASNVAAIAVQADGKIVIGGNFTSYDNVSRAYIARVNANGTLDGSFDPGFGVDGVVRCVILQADGKVLIGGAFSSAGGFSRDGVARLNVDGSLDTSFNSPGFDDGLGAQSSVYTMALQPNGKLIVGGYFPGVGGIQQWSIARLNTDGSRDSSFTPGTTLRQAVIYSVAIQPDGKVLAAGQIQSANNNTVPEDDIVRLNLDGGLDTSFGLAKQGFSSGFIRKVVLQPDGRVLIGGGAFTVNGGSQFFDVARLNSDGTLDNGFSVVTSGYPGGVYDLALQSSGSIYVGGGFTSVNGVTRKSVAKLTASGGVDPNFDPGVGPITSNNNNPAVLSLAVQVDNHVLIGGYFSSVDNAPRSNIARLLGVDLPRFANISTRMAIQTGDNVLIGGFIITGPAGSTKNVVIRGLGPSLNAGGVPVTGRMTDPLIELHKADGSVVTNDNWRDAPNLGEFPSDLMPGDNREAMIVSTLPPGGHTVIVKGAHGETGIGLVEVYDLDQGSPAKLANISTRGFVQTGDNVMIAGFIITGDGNATKRVIVRALAPSLSVGGLPVSGRMSDPTLQLFDANGASIGFNDNWRSSQEAEIVATNLAPPDDVEPAIIAILPRGGTTAIIRGKDNRVGIALVEVYALD